MDPGLVPKGPVDMKPSDLEGLHVGVCAYTYIYMNNMSHSLNSLKGVL